MRLKLLGILVAAGLWAPPSYASNVAYIVDPNTDGSGGEFNFLLTGYNSDPNALGALSVVFINIGLNLPGYEAQENLDFYAGVNGLPGALSPPFEILENYNNGYSPSECRYEYCSTYTTFFIPTGMLNIELTVGASFYTECYDYGAGLCEQPGAVIVGSPSYELELSVPNYLSVEPVPLPAALPLFAIGLGGFGLLGWRRRRKQSVA